MQFRMNGEQSSQALKQRQKQIALRSQLKTTIADTRSLVLTAAEGCLAATGCYWLLMATAGCWMATAVDAGTLPWRGLAFPSTSMFVQMLKATLFRDVPFNHEFKGEFQSIVFATSSKKTCIELARPRCKENLPVVLFDANSLVQLRCQRGAQTIS